MSVGHEDYTQYDWFSEAKVLEATEDYDKALEAYDEALEIDPGFAKAWFYKAQLLAKMGQKEEAIRCARETFKLNPAWEKHIRKFLPDAQL